MSAIVGIINFNDEPIRIEEKTNIMETFRKFPTDDSRGWTKDNLYFGCHAQWITPESIGEKLPYYDYNRKLLITADAIIDNREDLFNKLGIRQKDQSKIPDSQLILLAYEKWEDNVVTYLIGEFAFMIWDAQKKRLFGARDFAGSRTLYFYNKNNKFIFSTLIEPFFTFPFIKREINETWIAQYLAIPNMIDCVDSSLSVMEYIEQIPPSHYITSEGGKVHLTKYNVLSNEKLNYKNNGDYIEAFQEIFKIAVGSRLRTNSPIGAQLSGGLDSGTVVSFASKSLRYENKSLHTFSSIPDKNFIDWTPKHRIADERPLIQSTIDHVGNIDSHFLDFSGKSSYSEIDDILDIMETPYKFFENSVWIKGFYEVATQFGIKVLLSGARGNMGISWGPALDYYSILLKKMKWIRLVKEVHAYQKNNGIQRISPLLSIISKKAYPVLNRSESIYEFPQLINPEFARRTNVFELIKDNGLLLDGSNKGNIYEFRKQHFEKEFIWNTTGTTNTKFSLHYSIWNRDPTNDLRIIRYCLSVPEDQYVQNGWNRALVRNSTKSFLPDKVRMNQKFRGIQGADWIHRMEGSWNVFLKEIKQMKKDPIFREYFNVPNIEDSIHRAENGPIPSSAFDPRIRGLMRSLIVYRFLKKIGSKGGEGYEKTMAATGSR